MLSRLRAPGIATAVLTGACALALAAPASAHPAGADRPRTDPAGTLNLPPGYHYKVLATAGSTPVVSTESGATFAMPEDPDANVVVRDATGQQWLVTAHELTRVRPGETFLGDASKAYVPEQATTDDGDVDGWGSVTRIPLSRKGTAVSGQAQVITTGLHDLCAGALTPWGTFLVNEEFPFPGDTVSPLRSGWVWEVNPVTGAQTKLTGMGRMSHEQEALVGGSWYLTNDFGNDQFLFKFTPDSPQNLTAGTLYGLAFTKSADGLSGSGTWVEIPDANLEDPTAYMVAQGYSRSAYGFSKGEGIVATPSGDGLVFTESGAPTSTNPGRVWKFAVSATGLTGTVIAQGSFATLSHPDNIRFSPHGDLFIFEDNGSATETLANGGMNEVRVLPRGKTGTENTKVFATVPQGREPTGPWFADKGKLLYLSLQGEGGDTPGLSVVIRGPKAYGRWAHHGGAHH